MLDQWNNMTNYINLKNISSAAYDQTNELTIANFQHIKTGYMSYYDIGAIQISNEGQ